MHSNAFIQKKHEDISESPRRINPTDPNFGFQSLQDNSSLTSKILHDTDTILWDRIHGYPLYKLNNKMVIIDTFTNRIIYYLQWKDEYERHLNTTVATETLHWRDRSVSKLLGVSFLMYLDKLLEIHGSIMTDLVHTADGERFWINLISKAIENKLQVYYYNNVPSDVKIIKITDQYEFSSILNDYIPWGNKTKNQTQKFVISNKILVKMKND